MSVFHIKKNNEWIGWNLFLLICSVTQYASKRKLTITATWHNSVETRRNVETPSSRLLHLPLFWWRGDWVNVLLLNIKHIITSTWRCMAAQLSRNSTQCQDAHVEVVTFTNFFYEEVIGSMFLNIKERLPKMTSTETKKMVSITLDRRQSKTLLTIDERGQKIAIK